MKLALISFTSRGDSLAASLAEKLASQGVDAACTIGHGHPGFSLREWTGRAFSQSDGLLFIGAAGIAVRAVAPFLQGKAHDPAVVVMDEQGRFVISLLSGHLGGANALAKALAALTGGEAVITTATDGRGAFAVDNWAKRQGCRIPNPEKIKAVSAKALAGEAITVHTTVPISGCPPAGVSISDSLDCDVWVGAEIGPAAALRIVPPVGVLGVGCKKGIGADGIERAFQTALGAWGIDPLAVSGVCSIDRKAEEPGLLAFCKEHGWELRTFSARELAAAQGEFTPSAFVAQVTGVDNVCERAAVLGGGTLYRKKLGKDGVTMALALKPFSMDWSW